MWQIQIQSSPKQQPMHQPLSTSSVFQLITSTTRPCHKFRFPAVLSIESLEAESNYSFSLLCPTGTQAAKWENSTNNGHSLIQKKGQSLPCQDKTVLSKEVTITLRPWSPNNPADPKQKQKTRKKTIHNMNHCHKISGYNVTGML